MTVNPASTFTDMRHLVPQFEGKILLSPPGVTTHVDNDFTLSPEICSMIKTIFEEQGVGDGTLLLSQGLVEYEEFITPDSSKPHEFTVHINVWPMIYLPSDTPQEVVSRLRTVINTLDW